MTFTIEGGNTVIVVLVIKAVQAEVFLLHRNLFTAK